MSNDFVRELTHRSDTFFVSSLSIQDVLKHYGLVDDGYELFDAWLVEGERYVAFDLAREANLLSTDEVEKWTAEKAHVDNVSTYESLFWLVAKNYIPSGIYVIEVDCL